MRKYRGGGDKCCKQFSRSVSVLPSFLQGPPTPGVPFPDCQSGEGSRSPLASLRRSLRPSSTEKQASREGRGSVGPGRPQSLVDRGADLRAVPEPCQGPAPSSTPQNVAGDLSIPRDTRSLGDDAKAAPGPPGAREPSPGAAPSPPARGLGAQRPLN